MISPYEKKIARILVVDDDQILNQLFCEYLNDKGFVTLPATGVHDAKKYLQTDDDIDLILLDYQLGDGVGMDLLDESAVRTYRKLAPIIMISANEDPDFLELCFARGVNDYIIKPVNLSLLALKVDALIKSANMQRLITAQKNELEIFKNTAEREEQIARFTYEYVLRQNSHDYDGINLWLKSLAAFSGDIALVKTSPGGNLFFMLADATGHGLSAAITIMPVVLMFNSMITRGCHIQQIVTELNRKLEADTPEDRFVAAVLIEINPFSRELSIWNGGMPNVYWINRGEIAHEFKSAHMALGILPEDIFDANVATLKLPDDGFIFACSDGLYEQENSSGEPFSVGRLKNIIAQQPADLLSELSGALTQHLGSDNFSDDVSICTIEPRRVFKEFAHPSALIGNNFDHIGSDPFSLRVELVGKKLEACDVSALCNNFLQELGVDQQLRQKIFAVVAEMLSNAIDHGVLKLSSALKDHSDNFTAYFIEREKRLKALTENDFIILNLYWNATVAPYKLVVEVEDSGEGHHWVPAAELASTSAQDISKLSGRGTVLIQGLSESVEVIAPGNKIRAIIK